MSQELVTIETDTKLMTLDEFLDWYPDGYGRFELHNGEIIEMQPTGTHERVTSFLALKQGIEIERLALPYFVARQCVVKPSDSDKSCYIPDVIILDEKALENEPLWKKRSLITKGESARLVIEVVSTNWQDDYLMKLGEYEKMGIPEYWIVDYLGLGGRRYIGNPKQPTISVYQMVDGEYMVRQFRDNEQIESAIFPELNLMAKQIFKIGQ
ncbi:Uma2 family endonuclease [Argonema antarcticum]|uniref:Uma2 family endonuclease n=1 Tax=Argonema antarcticum TaxID=2942763 RepID=UPI00201154C2|nr:Uma2 family endonuclease [Argonema antarcticum]MCL1471677.1 Uma2 family endonuclease [Argonema antarcticum A004/B2]